MKQQSGTAKKKLRSVGQKRRRRLRIKYQDAHAAHAVKRQKRHQEEKRKQESKQAFYSWRDAVVATWKKIFGSKKRLDHLEQMEDEIKNYQTRKGNDE